MSRKKLFIENIFAYGFINILNQLVPFILLPIITRMLNDASDFGVYSMYTTVVGFGTPIAVLGLYDAMFREYFENDDIEYKYNVTTTTHKIITVSSTAMLILMILFNRELSNLFFGNERYVNVIVYAAIGVFLGSIITTIQAPTRIQNKKKLFIISGLISSLVTYILALILIYCGFSYLGLIYSSIIATLALLIFFWSINRRFFSKGVFDKNIAKELFKIGLPLLPTFLIYWIYNSADRIMISNILGTFDLGVYSIGAKVAQISQLLYSAFAGGWQYFAFSTMKDDDQVELNSKIFEYMGVVVVFSFILIYPFMPIIFNILFNGDYVYGYIVAPYLYLSPLLLMLFQIVANQFLVIKKSYLSTLSLSLGVFVNVILNFILISKWGIEGAAVSTLIGYMITLIIVIIISYRLKYMIYSRKILVVLSMIPFYCFVQRILFIGNIELQFLFMFFLIFIIFIMYRKEVKLLLEKRIT